MMNAEINKQMKLSQHLTSSSEAALSHSSKLDGLRLSPHFTLGELCKTSVKTKDGNIPSRVHIENLKRLTGWLETLRDESGESFDELFIEQSAKSIWVHFAVRPSENRRKVDFIKK